MSGNIIKYTYIPNSQKINSNMRERERESWDEYAWVGKQSSCIHNFKPLNLILF